MEKAKQPLEMYPIESKVRAIEATTTLLGAAIALRQL